MSEKQYEPPMACRNCYEKLRKSYISSTGMQCSGSMDGHDPIPIPGEDRPQWIDKIIALMPPGVLDSRELRSHSQLMPSLNRNYVERAAEAFACKYAEEPPRTRRELMALLWVFGENIVGDLKRQNEFMEKSWRDSINAFSRPSIITKAPTSEEGSAASPEPKEEKS